MAGQRGRDMLVKAGDGESPGTFLVVAVIRARAISLGAGLVDATTAESPDAWQELIASAGTRAAEITGSGLFKDAASDERVLAAFFAGGPMNLKLVIPGCGELSGPFLIAALTYSGDHDGEAASTIKLSSSGVIGFQAE